MTEHDFLSGIPVPLDPQQRQAVCETDGPVLLLAVPGSGKTTVLVTRLGYLIQCCGVQPEEILTMTYTVAATVDMRSRFAAFFGNELAQRLEFRTINGVSARIIQQYERIRGRKAFSLITDERISTSILSESYRRHAGGFASDSTVKAIRARITYIKNQMLQEPEIEKMQMEDIPLAAIYQDYCRALRQQGLMDYDDQMVYAYQILLRYPEILSALQQRYRYYCVDEAQDTSKIQHCIIRLLAQKRGNLFMVGDEDQSIYGFRAACPEALMTFERDYPGAKVLLMERNYRSTGQIVEAADRFIQQNRQRHRKHMLSVAGKGPAIGQIFVQDRMAQYQYLAQLAGHCEVETAVLYRNNESALPVIDLLDRAGIPYRCRQFDGSFFTHRIVRDLTDILRFSEDPSNGEIFLRIYYKLNAGITKAVAEYAAAQHGNRPVLDALLEIVDLPQRTQVRCKAVKDHLKQLPHEIPDQAIDRIVRLMGYGDYLEQHRLDRSKVDILEAIARSEPTLQQFLMRLDKLSEIVQQGNERSDCSFILSTIHSSKGLEYERVILMDVLDGILPNVELANEKTASKEDQLALEEERRLFYVGMTRARRELQVVCFRRPSLRATFADALFTTPKGQAPRRVTAQKEPEQLAEALFSENVRVQHRKFGCGVIIKRQGDIVSIQFDSGEMRRFSLHTALHQHVLRLAD